MALQTLVASGELTDKTTIMDSIDSQVALAASILGKLETLKSTGQMTSGLFDLVIEYLSPIKMNMETIKTGIDTLLQEIP